MKSPSSATEDMVRIPLNSKLICSSSSRINGPVEMSQGPPPTDDRCLALRRPDRPYMHTRTEIHVTDLYLHHRYLSIPSRPTTTLLLRDRGAREEWQQATTTLFKTTGNSERHLPHDPLTYAGGSGAAAAVGVPRQGPRCNLYGGASSPSKKLLRLPAPRFQCTSCQKSYSTLNGLSKHREFHCSAGGSVQQPRHEYHCHQCDKVYTSVSALKMHIRTHTLPCRCKLCGKAFSRPWLLQGHLRTHTGEKPFKCNHCGRAFADRSNLRAHLQTHYEVKQYNCPTCHKTFSRMSLLIKHQHNSCI